MIRDGYGLEPEEVEIAVRWLQLNHPEEPVGLPKVLKLGKHGGDRRSERFKTENQSDRITLKRGTDPTYLEARLEKEATNSEKAAKHLAAYRRGHHKSINAAARAAGIVKTPSPFAQVQRLWSKLTDDEKNEIRRMP